MPSPTTALLLIEDALGLTQAVGVDQTLTSDETSDGLRTFNDLLEIFSINNLAVWGEATQTFNTIANQAVYTIGTGGNWVTTRPVRIYDPAYTVMNGVTFPCTSMTQAEYNEIGLKGQTQQFASRYLWINDFPLGLITLWPTPTDVLPITFTIDGQMTAVSSASATLTFPPGYAMVFKYKLAVMLAPLFGKKIKDYPDVVAIANSSFADICRANKKPMVMNYDMALTRSASGYANFLQGY